MRRAKSWYLGQLADRGRQGLAKGQTHGRGAVRRVAIAGTEGERPHRQPALIGVVELLPLGHAP